MRRDRRRPHAAPTDRARRLRSTPTETPQEAASTDPASPSPWGTPRHGASGPPPAGTYTKTDTDQLPAPGARPRRRRIGPRRVLLVALVLVLAVVVVGGVLLWGRVSSFNAQVSSRGTLSSALWGPLGGTERVNVAHVRVRRDPKHGGTYLADSINILSVDPKAGTTTLIPIPRDLWVQGLPEIPNNGKINEAFATAGPTVDGRTRARWRRRCCRRSPGLRIDHLLAIDFAGFASVIDAVGGVTINNPTAFKYTWSEANYTNKKWSGGAFKKGTLHLDWQAGARLRPHPLHERPQPNRATSPAPCASSASSPHCGPSSAPAIGSLGPGLAMMDALDGQMQTDLSAIDLFLSVGPPDHRPAARAERGRAALEARRTPRPVHPVPDRADIVDRLRADPGLAARPSWRSRFRRPPDRRARPRRSSPGRRCDAIGLESGTCHPPGPRSATQHLRAILRQLPTSPGVYLMKSADGRVLYVGKADSCATACAPTSGARRRSTARILRMVGEVANIDYIVTDTVSEAFLLEGNLIKEHRPRFNIRLRDDKSYPFVKITLGEDFPRIVRTRKLARDGSRYFGPYASASSVDETLKLLRRIFPFRTCNLDIPEGSGCSSGPASSTTSTAARAPASRPSGRQHYREPSAGSSTSWTASRRESPTSLQRRCRRTPRRCASRQAAVARDKLRAVERTIEQQKVAAFAGPSRTWWGWRARRGRRASSCS